MAKPDYSMPGSPCWADLMTTDPDRAVDFYGQIFGWTAERGGEEVGGYISFAKDSQGVGGAMQSRPDTGPPNVWSVYLSASDVNTAAKAATQHGGRVHVPPMQVMDLGTMAFLEDAGGAAIGVWQAGSHKGFDVIGETGTPNWFELLTRDYDVAVRWYRDVLGWETAVASDTDEFRYTTLGEGEDQRAGVMDATGFLPDGVPAHWSIYFGVADADSAITEIERLGGSVMQPAETTPYGRMAQVADPMGALFKVIDPSRREG